MILEAAELRFALKHGMADLNEVIEWADALILKMDVGNNDIFDIAMSKTKYEAFTNLGKFSGKVDTFRILRRFSLRFLNIEVIKFSTALKIAEDTKLFFLSKEKLPADMEQIQKLYFILDYAPYGWSQNSKTDAVKTFLSTYRSLAQEQPNSPP